MRVESFQFSVFSFQFSVFSFQFSVFSSQFSVLSSHLSVFSFQFQCDDAKFFRPFLSRIVSEQIIKIRTKDSELITGLTPNLIIE